MSKIGPCAIAVTAVLLLARPSFAQQGAAAQQLQGFSIVLVQGTAVAGSDSTLPVAARRAIADMKDVLPFRSYQLLDSAWILSSTDLMRARLRGPDGVDYNVALETSPSSVGNRRVVFSLREVGARPATENVARDQAALLATYEDLQMTLMQALRAAGGKAETGQKRDGDQTVEFLRAQLADTERRLAELNLRSGDQARGNAPERAAPDLELLRQAVGKAEDDLKRLGEKFLPQHPDVVVRRRQLETARLNLAIAERAVAEKAAQQASPVDAARREAQLLVQRIREIEAEMAELGSRLGERHPEMARLGVRLETARRSLAQAEAEAQKTQRAAATAGQAAEGVVIDTTFTIGLGETVVVGTSRVRGDTAVVVVLTAVPQSRGRGAF